MYKTQKVVIPKTTVREFQISKEDKALMHQYSNNHMHNHIKSNILLAQKG